MIRSPLLLLSGCPFVFGPPNLTNVEGGTPFTDTVEGNTDLDGDADPSAPTVVSFEVVPRMTQVVLHFAIADADNDLVGGSLSVSDGTTGRTFDIPGDVDVWDPLGTSTILLPMVPRPGTQSWLDCNTPVHETWSAVPIDLEGNVGLSVQASLDIVALGSLPEGDGLGPLGQHVVSEVPPFMGCVGYEIDPDDPRSDNQQLARDVEAIEFTTPPGGYVAETQWDPANGADIDLYVHFYPIVDVNPQDMIADSIDFSVTDGPSPEQATWSATNDQAWLMDLLFFQILGGEPPFEAQFLVSPE